MNWVVEGEGAALLGHAVANIGGSLEKHSFSFANPKANLPRLLQSLGQRNAQLEGDFIKLDPSRGGAVGSALAVASQKQALLEQLNALPATQSKIPEMAVANQILRIALVGRVAALGGSERAQTVAALPQALRGSRKTFIDVLFAARGK